MTKVSKRFLNKELEKHIFELFIKTVVDLKNEADARSFLEDLLSPTEKIMLVKRLAIAVLLTKGYTYDEIDNTLKVSRSTIMNVSYWLKHGNTGYLKAVDRIMQQQKKEAFIDKIEEILLQLSPPKLYGSSAFIKKQQEGKELYKRKVKRNLL